jgi:microcystin-dependent protein
MSFESISPNMNLVLPGVGQTLGPQYATDLNNSLTIIDGHNHTAGYGVPIPSSGLNINADLLMNNNNLIGIKSLRMQPQIVLNGPSDLSALFVNGVDLYYNDGIGNHVRITQSGGVAGSPGSISNLTSPASATYVAGSQTFVWQSAANTPANLDAASITFRNLVANSFGLTLNPPNAMAADSSITLPVIPSSQKIMTLDASGNMAAAYSVDNTTLSITSNVISVAPNGIDYAQLATAVANALCPPGSIIASGNTGALMAAAGWLACDGASYLITDYPNLFTWIGTAYGTADSTHFNVPDFNGRFLRQVDNGTGRDPDANTRIASNPGGNTGDNVGSLQDDAFASHSHNVPASSVINANASIGLSGNAVNAAIATSSVGAAETRPKNVYVYYYIKA